MNLKYKIVEDQSLTKLEKAVNDIIKRDSNAQICGAMVVIPVPNGQTYYAQTMLVTP